MSKVPFVDLGAQYAAIGPEVDAAMRAVLADKAFINGPHAAAFEAAFATFCGAGHCVGVGNGTDALRIAMHGLGLGPGDEALVPANTFIATSEAVSLCGATPVFVDVEPAGRLMDLDDARRKITPRTRAIVPVHLFGQPVDMAAVRALADEFGLKIVQDCAQAHGATFAGKPLADYGDACCYSFYPGKNLGAYGDAGAVVCNDDALAQRCRMFANHGRKDKYDHEFEGVNSRMDGLQAAVLGAKLPHLNDWNEARRAHAAAYDGLLAGVPGLTPPAALPNRRHVYHLYVVRTPKRDALRARLSEAGVASGVHYPIALPDLSAYAARHGAGSCPVASRLAGESLSLPIYPELRPEQIELVAATVADFCRKA